MYEPVYGAADIGVIYEQAGLKPPENVEDFTSSNFERMMHEVMSDGEVVMATGADYREPPEQRYGESYVKFKALWHRALENPSDPETHEMQKLGRFIGTLLAVRVGRGEIIIPNTSMLQPDMRDTRTLMIDDRPRFHLPRNHGKVFSILDLGAGLAGERFIRWQVMNLKRRELTQYLPVNRGTMQNQFLVERATAHFESLEAGIAKQIIGRYFVGREDGIVEFVDVLTNEPSASGSISVVSCNALGSMEGTKLAASLTKVPDLLQPGGAVQVGLHVEPVVRGGATFAQARQALVDSGMKIDSQVTHETGNKLLGRQSISTFAFFTHAT